MISPERSIVDLVTPFDGDDIDERGFADVVAWQISQGTNGLATCTTTGEGPTLTDVEKERLIRICVEVASRRVPVIAATGTDATDSTIALTRMAKAAGAHAALIVTPYYSRPSQEGVCRHYEAVARAIDLPVILHNVPSRTGVDLLPATVERLSRIAPIVAICEQSPDPLRPLATARAAGDRIAQLCGDDTRALAFSLAGARGCLSALANVLPAASAALQRACVTSQHGLTRDICLRLAPLMEALGSDAGPAPVKRAMTLARPGFRASCRLPMVEQSDQAPFPALSALQELLADPFWTHVAVEDGPGQQRSTPRAKAAT